MLKPHACGKIASIFSKSTLHRQISTNLPFHSQVFRLKEEFLASFPAKLQAKLEQYGLKKAQGDFSISQQLLWHIDLINREMIQFEVKNKISQEKQDAVCLTVESIALAAFIFDCLDNWKVNLKVKNESLLKVMDLVLCVGSQFAVSAEDPHYSLLFSQMVREVSELLFEIERIENGDQSLETIRHMFWQLHCSKIERNVRYLYHSSCELSDSDKAKVELLARTHGQLYGLYQILEQSEPLAIKAIRSKSYSAFKSQLAHSFNKKDLSDCRVKFRDTLESILKPNVNTKNAPLIF